MASPVSARSGEAGFVSYYTPPDSDKVQNEPFPNDDELDLEYVSPIEGEEEYLEVNTKACSESTNDNPSKLLAIAKVMGMGASKLVDGGLVVIEIVGYSGAALNAARRGVSSCAYGVCLGGIAAVKALRAAGKASENVFHGGCIVANAAYGKRLLSPGTERALAVVSGCLGQVVSAGLVYSNRNEIKNFVIRVVVKQPLGIE